MMNQELALIATRLWWDRRPIEEMDLESLSGADADRVAAMQRARAAAPKAAEAPRRPGLRARLAAAAGNIGRALDPQKT